MRNRYSLPAIGRFISRDPIGITGGINLYTYAGDDPVDFSDPTGLAPAPLMTGHLRPVRSRKQLMVLDRMPVPMRLLAMPRLLRAEVWL